MNSSGMSRREELKVSTCLICYQFMFLHFDAKCHSFLKLL
jgi:hypothetical protein